MALINDGYVTQHTYNAVGNAMLRIAEIADRHDEREANYAVCQATDFVKNGFSGVDKIDETGKRVHVPGISDRTWKEFDNGNTDAIKESENLCKSVRQQEFYTKLNGNQRRLFDRSWQFKENELRRSATQVHARNVGLKAKEQDLEMMAFNNKSVERVFGNTDGAYERMREWATAQNFGIMMGTGIKNRDVLNLPNCTFDDIAKAEGWNEGQTKIARMKWDNLRATFDEMRVNALTFAGANNQPLGSIPADQCLIAAAKITNELNGNFFGVDEKTGMKKFGKDKDGKELQPGHEYITDAKRNELLANIEKASKSQKVCAENANRAAYNEKLNDLGELELDLANPKKVDDIRLDYDGYAKIISSDNTITREQKISLMKNYRKLCDYKEKYDADLAKHTAAVAAKEEKQKSEYGWLKEDGSFVPSSAFPKDSDSTSMKEFNEEAAIWQNPKTAMARLEAARMTGRLSEADYKRYYSYGTMMMDKDAQTWWFKNYGKFNIAGLTSTDYGETDVGKDIRKSRERGNYSAASGIFAANRGVAKTYKNAADFVADTLEQDSGKNNGNESLVPIETLPKVYDTIRRFARAGVDPADAVRAILQPALQQGISRNLTERLSDPEYFEAVVDDFKKFGTHFTETANANAANFIGTNWKADRNQALTSNLVNQGRLKVGK